MKAMEYAKEILSQQTNSDSFQARARDFYLLAAWSEGSKRASRVSDEPRLRRHCHFFSILLAKASHKASPTWR